jgi:hypothetical protein
VNDEPARIVKVVGPTCDTGRHYPPHPGDTCDEIDDWIRLRNQVLTDFFAQAYARMTEASNEATLAGTAFAAAIAEPIPQPEHDGLQRALNLLAPHLAWDHRYQP